MECPHCGYDLNEHTTETCDFGMYSKLRCMICNVTILMTHNEIYPNMNNKEMWELIPSE